MLVGEAEQTDEEIRDSRKCCSSAWLKTYHRFDGFKNINVLSHNLDPPNPRSKYNRADLESSLFFF